MENDKIEIQRARCKEYYIKNKEKIIAKRKEDPKNKEKIKERQKKYKDLYPERVIEQNRKAYLKRKDVKIEKGKEWLKNNRDKHNAVGAKQRMLKTSTDDGSVTKEKLNELLLSQNNKCTYCNIDISINYEPDHIIPLIRNGKHTISNIQMLCSTCNRRKNAKTHEEFFVIINKYKIK